MADLNIQTLGDFVRNAEIMWNMGIESVPQVMRNSGLVKEMNIPQMTGNVREFTEIDLEEYASFKGESDQTVRARVQQGYSKTATLSRIGKQISISYEMRTQGKYFEIKQKITNLGKLVPNRLDLDLSHRIGFGTATTYLDQDGRTIDISVGDTLALFSTAHTLRGSSTTFRNRLATNPQLSRGSLEAMEKVRVENTLNQFAQKMYMTDDILWTTDDPNTINTAKELLRSTANPTSSNNGVINTYQSKYKLVVIPRIATDANGAVDSTKAKYWGLASSQHSTFYLGVHEEAHLESPVQGSSATDFSTQDWNFGTWGGYLMCIVSATWIGGSTGDGTA
jgi:hypothetical protein